MYTSREIRITSRMLWFVLLDISNSIYLTYLDTVRTRTDVDPGSIVFWWSRLSVPKVRYLKLLL